MALNWHLTLFWKASSFATNNSTVKKIAFLSLGQLSSKSVSQSTDPATLVQRHVADAVSLPAAACGMYSHPRDPGALWRTNSRLPHGSSLPGWQRYNLAAKDQLASGFPYYLLLKWQSVVFGSEHSLFTFVTFRLSLTLRQLLTCKYAIISNILVQLSTQFFPLKKTVDTSHTE